MNLGVELSMLALNFYSDLHGLPLCPVFLFAIYECMESMKRQATRVWSARLLEYGVSGYKSMEFQATRVWSARLLEYGVSGY